MGRRSITGGVLPAGPGRIQFNFIIDGVRFRPTLPWTPNQVNLDRAPVTLSSQRQILDHAWRPHLGSLPFLGLQHSMLIKIADSRNWNKKTYNNAISALRRAFAFGYLDYPDHRDPAASLKCARIGKKDRPAIDPFSIQGAEVFIAALHNQWGEVQGNYDEFRFFTGLRPSEQIALVVADYDCVRGVLSVSKARVDGIDKDCTKTGEDRRIRLCPRAVSILERQLRLRARLVAEGRIKHQHLFFTDDGSPIPDVKYPYRRWKRTLKRLAIRYRKPYAARHTSVSWNLMLGRNPLLVAKEHGHRVITMLTVYAAWTEGAVETDILAIREAMNRTDLHPPRSPQPRRLCVPPVRSDEMSAAHETDENPNIDGDDPNAFGSGFASRFASSDLCRA
jgi:integrase